jgi:hypothetical protein
MKNLRDLRVSESSDMVRENIWATYESQTCTASYGGIGDPGTFPSSENS